MKAEEIIKIRQLEWAKRNGIKTYEKYQYYCENVNANIYGGKLYENVREQFKQGSGNELKGSKTEPAKMNSVFSSSALCVNMFQHFIDENENIRDFANNILVACGLIKKTNKGKVTSIVFEKKFQTGIATPNLDVVIEFEVKSKKQLFAIESKFTEPYSSHSGNFLKEKYCSKENREIWRYKNCDIYKALKIDNKEKICRLIKKDGKEEREEGRYIFDYKYLDGAQLIKHILGIINNLNEKDNTEIILVYLWYDAFGAEGAMHREEIEDFRKTIEDATCQKIKVRHATYQEVIVTLCNNLDYEMHKDYINYLTERYL